jgi:hypothetical protein
MKFPGHTLIWWAVPRSGPAGTFASQWAKRLGKAILIYAEASRTANSAAALFESLSRLPEAELVRRGMTRRDINRQVFDHLTRHS